jgi:quinol monooxygenase YgiN
MSYTPAPMPDFLAEPSRIGSEISVTGKWVPSKPNGRFRKTVESQEMLAEWEDIHAGASADAGVLSTEINHAVGEDAVLVHHVFADPDALVEYFSTTAAEHMAALSAVATPQLHLVRGVDIPTSVRDAISAKNVPVTFGEWAFGFVRDDYGQPDPAAAIQVTAKWTCLADDTSTIDELEYWWQRVGTEAHTLEEGLLRFETYRADGEDALIIHETFADTSVLKFHLTKGTAAIFKDDIDKIAAPENYYFRGPVSWTIRTYSKFMQLPATYSSRGSHHTVTDGTMSEGTTVSTTRNS